MILMVDARSFLWWASNDAELQPGARAAISDPANDVIVSAATVWELETKRARGKLTAPPDLLEVIDLEGFSCLPVSGTDAIVAARLPPHHRDPFDRMLVAQALRLGAIVVTRDHALGAYEVEILTA